MRLRIVRPLPPQIEGFDLAAFRFGASYEIHPPLYDLLLVTGYGVPDDEPPVDPAIALEAFTTVIVAGDHDFVRPKRSRKPSKPKNPKTQKPREPGRKPRA